MGARTGLRMTLKPKCRRSFMSHALNCPIEQGSVGDLDLVRELRLIQAKSMILAGNHDHARL